MTDRRQPSQSLLIRRVAMIVHLAILGALPMARAQDRLKSMPGYESFQKGMKEIPGSVRFG